MKCPSCALPCRLVSDLVAYGNLRLLMHAVSAWDESMRYEQYIHWGMVAVSHAVAIYTTLQLGNLMSGRAVDSGFEAATDVSGHVLRAW